MKLSILDQSTASEGRPQTDAIRETIELAKLAEQLGYDRYWVSEHHNSDCIVGTAPEILMAAIGASTSRIRIGSAGVMLPHYSALKVAEQFRVLEGIAPGRIDLGLGRAPGSDRLTAYALNPNAAQAADYFPQQILDLKAWVSGQPLVEEHPFAQITAHPMGPTTPQMWMLGSSDYGARLGAHFGMPYAYAYFFMDGRGAEQAINLYRENYEPSEEFPQAKPTICVWALAADTEEEAWRQFRSREYWKVNFEKGLRPPLISPEKAADIPYTNSELARIDQLRQAAFVGTGEQVYDQISAEAKRLDLDEVVVVTWTFDPEPRRRSYELLAKAAGLKPVSEAA